MIASIIDRKFKEKPKMINAGQIMDKAQGLDSMQLQELADFVDFLLSKQQTITKRETVFPASQLESIETPSTYLGKSLSLEDMQAAIEWEAGGSV